MIEVNSFYYCKLSERPIYVLSVDPVEETASFVAYNYKESMYEEHTGIPLDWIGNTEVLSIAQGN